MAVPQLIDAIAQEVSLEFEPHAVAEAITDGADPCEANFILIEPQVSGTPIDGAPASRGYPAGCRRRRHPRHTSR